MARIYFTCYFVSAHFENIFIHKLHFTEQELHRFRKYFTEYTGENTYENTNRNIRERTIENFLNKYNTYKIGIKNCQQQLDYMSVPYGPLRFGWQSSSYYITNNTERVALDRMTSKKALDLLEEIEQYKLIISSIDNALTELDEKQKNFVRYRYFDNLKMYEVKAKMNVSEEKALYRIRRQVLDKFFISLVSLMNFK